MCAVWWTQRVLSFTPGRLRLQPYAVKASKRHHSMVTVLLRQRVGSHTHASALTRVRSWRAMYAVLVGRGT